MSVRKEDILDSDFVDAPELGATGLSDYVSGVTVVSTAASNKRIVVSGFNLPLDTTRVESGDIVTLTGNAAAGVYTVDQLIDLQTFSVVENIVNSTGGTAAFRYQAGGKKVGFNPTGQTATSANNLQDAVLDLATQVQNANNPGGTGFLTRNEHRNVRQLIHFISQGPAEGFATGAYRETLPAANPFPTSIIWWESSAKLKKIVEKTLTYNSNRTPSVTTWKMYDTDGTTIVTTVTDTHSYSGIFETSRTRSIS